jgi:PleD family two-component response regulator
MSEFVLIIESDTAELRKLREILTREGYNIMTAADEETALKICRQVPVTMILCETALWGFSNKNPLPVSKR